MCHIKTALTFSFFVESQIFSLVSNVYVLKAVFSSSITVGEDLAMLFALSLVKLNSFQWWCIKAVGCTNICTTLLLDICKTIYFHVYLWKRKSLIWRTLWVVSCRVICCDRQSHGSQKDRCLTWNILHAQLYLKKFLPISLFFMAFYFYTSFSSNKKEARMSYKQRSDHNKNLKWTERETFRYWAQSVPFGGSWGRSSS